jgi:uncharacterized membrane protein YoaK (UPF0700 family)
MLNVLPKWIETGGFCMAAIAGAVNGVAMLGFTHQAVSHLTGLTTMVGVSLIEYKWGYAAKLLLILLAFLLGAVIAGALIGNAVLRLGRRYSFALILEGLLLLGAMYALLNDSELGYFLASAACGLQNGMVSAYSGAVVRTTHMTGLVTDLGTLLGARLRGQQIDRRKVALYLILISGFMFGAAVGASAFYRMGYHALRIPAYTSLSLALLYSIYRYLQSRKQFVK